MTTKEIKKLIIEYLTSHGFETVDERNVMFTLETEIPGLAFSATFMEIKGEMSIGMIFQNQMISVVYIDDNPVKVGPDIYDKYFIHEGIRLEDGDVDKLKSIVENHIYFKQIIRNDKLNDLIKN